MSRSTFGAGEELAGQPTDAELIAQVLGGSRPSPAVARCAATVARLPLWERRVLGAAGLVREHGVTPDRALRLAAVWELAERWFPDDRPAITSPREAVLLLGGLRSACREQVWVLMLDARHRPISCETVAVGTINSSRLAPRDVLAPALRAGSAALVVAHNHPSGDPAPSRADRQVTDALRSAAALVGIPMLDHIIVAARGHHSFREVEGWDVVTAA
ncbi:MAG: Mov34/MPN/PAD-1 family protein [Candidatus Dormibacteraeota bacterium]|uniref:Mov34/MPN/PAD-1 family protein n=1 Tax=Candidatus Aeolococcus gillhamiae TaxID=3127015 RepID=A0A934MZ62_9BACT|nr:Mov34/MPN/PAD-1 family protein [Candidatus Dormibacteraeota bacterium]